MTGDDIILIAVHFRKYIGSAVISLICRWCAVSCQYHILNIGLVWELSNLMNLRQYNKGKVTHIMPLLAWGEGRGED